MKLQECKFGCLLGILLSLLATDNLTQAQVYTPDFAWAAMGSADPAIYSRGVAVDRTGNSYVTGEFRESAQFGVTKLTGSGVRNVFLAKYGPAGQLLWARQSGGVLGSVANSVAIDPEGNAILTGSFGGVCTFGGISLTNRTNNYGDLFIVKYSSRGEVVWARQWGTTGDDDGAAIAVDGSGNAFVTGVLHLTQTFGGQPQTDPKLQKIYIAKYSVNGDVIWEKTLGGNLGNEGKGIGVDGMGNVYVTGYFWYTNLFGPNSISGSASFLAKYDGAGSLLWATKTGEYGRVQGIAVDDPGNSYLVGHFAGEVTFGTYVLISTNHTSNGFVIKYDPTGKALWAKQISTYSKSLEYSYYMKPRSIAVDSSGNCYFTGLFLDTAFFGTIGITNYITPSDASPNEDGFIAKCDGNGNYLWARDVGHVGNDAGTGIAVDAQGNAYLTGIFRGMITLGKTTLLNWDSGMFVAQMPAFYLTSPILNQTTGKLQFVLAAQSGRKCTIEYSTDLVHWLALATNQIPAAGFLELDYGVLSGVDRGFYRARSVSP